MMKILCVLGVSAVKQGFDALRYKRADVAGTWRLDSLESRRRARRDEPTI